MPGPEPEAVPHSRIRDHEGLALQQGSVCHTLAVHQGRCASLAPFGCAFGAALTHREGAAAKEGMLQIQSLVIQFTTSLQPQLAAVEARDARFADQLRRSLLSVGLNLGEGHGASGGAKRQAYRVARGEAGEFEMGLEMAVALGYCSVSATQWEALQRILATLQKLARPHR